MLVSGDANFGEGVYFTNLLAPGESEIWVQSLQTMKNLQNIGTLITRQFLK